MKNFNFEMFGKTYTGHFTLGKYCDMANLYIGLELENGDYWDDVSVNLGVPVAEDCIAIRCYNDGEYYIKLFKELGIFIEELSRLQNGFASFKIIRLDLDKLKEYGVNLNE